MATAMSNAVRMGALWLGTNQVNAGDVKSAAIMGTSSGTYLNAPTTNSAISLSFGGIANPYIFIQNGIMQISNTLSTPGSAPSGGYLYVQSGALIYYGASGTITTIGYP
jgi:hypothetical protein